MKRLGAVLLALSLAGLAPAYSQAACLPVPGADALWANSTLRWLLIGELHGSNETPAAFLNLVCDALAHGKRVTVAVERPTSEQAALKAILTSENLQNAKVNLLKQSDWATGMDGRASEAMLRLLTSLGGLHKLHPSLQVAAFEAPFSEIEPGSRDEAMGHTLLELVNKYPHNLILVLTGNAHVMQNLQFGYSPAAMFLPSHLRLSLKVTDTGGHSWANYNGACGSSSGTVEIKSGSKPYGIFLDPALAPYGKVDGVLSLGIPLTSSNPAVGEPFPLLPCRVKFLAEHPAVP